MNEPRQDTGTTTRRPRGTQIARLLLPVLALLAPMVATAQNGPDFEYVADTFEVTVVEKTAAHPHYGVGSKKGFAIDGVEGATIVLQRNTAYAFRMIDVPTSHLFVISTQALPAKSYQGGRFYPRNRADENDTLYFEPPVDAPDTLYYASPEPLAGGMILLVDSLPSSVDRSSRHEGNDGVMLTVAPQPARASTTFRIDLADPAAVRLEICNLLGTPVESRSLDRASSHTIAVTTEGWPAGTYWYRLVASGAGETLIRGGRLEVVR